MTIVSRNEARTHGLKWYFTGLPCVRGHTAARRVTNRECRICRQEDDRERQKLRRKNPKARAEDKMRMRRWLGYPEPTRPMPELCECCGNPPSGNGRGGKTLHLDHDHETGKFRGWVFKAQRAPFLKRLEEAQIARAPDFHAGGIMDWSPAERGNELGGELGELVAEILALQQFVGAAQNDLKKLLRFDRRHTIVMPEPGTVRKAHCGKCDDTQPLFGQLREERDAIVSRIRAELADVFICTSLVAIQLGIDVELAVTDKFNATSDKIGSTVLL